MLVLRVNEKTGQAAKEALLADEPAQLDLGYDSYYDKMAKHGHNKWNK